MQDRNDKIYAASQGLERNALTPMDFLNQILHNDKELTDSLDTVNDGMQTADDESTLDADVEADVVVEMKSIADSDAQVDTHEGVHFGEFNMIDNIPDTKDGACITCITNMASVVFLDCKHNAVCVPCWEICKEMRKQNCHRWYGDNARKLERELKIIKCPKCGAIARDTLVIHTNAF